MTKYKHTLESVLISLKKKKDVKIICSESGNEIHLNKTDNRKNDLGGGSYGKIDFLKSQYNFKVINQYKKIN